MKGVIMKNGEFVDVTDYYNEVDNAVKKLKSNSDLAIMCVDNCFVIVDTSKNWEIVKNLANITKYSRK